MLICSHCLQCLLSVQGNTEWSPTEHSEWTLHRWLTSRLSRRSRLWLSYSIWGLWWNEYTGSLVEALKTRQRSVISCGRWIKELQAGDARDSSRYAWIGISVHPGHEISLEYQDSRNQSLLHWPMSVMILCPQSWSAQWSRRNTLIRQVSPSASDIWVGYSCLWFFFLPLWCTISNCNSTVVWVLFR